MPERSRSRKAEAALKRVGMPQLHVLDGGLNGWIVSASRCVGRERISLERQVRIAAGALAAAGGLLAVKAHLAFRAALCVRRGRARLRRA